jgi:hypothetical protein
VTLALTLTSTGNSPVTISAESLTGAGFTVSGATFPVTLNPTVAINLQVQFDPAVTGAAAGQLTLTSNSTTGSKATVTLSGTGAPAQHEVTLTWNPPASTPVPISAYNVYRSTGGTSSYVLVNTTGSTQTTYLDTGVQAATTYAYYVKSVDSAGLESVPSNQVTVNVP